MKVIILAGGRGTRLWPLSQDFFPKQLLSFGDTYSLLQKTILRFLPLYGASSLLIVTSKECEALVKKQCLELSKTEKIPVLVEPCSKSTAPSLALAVRFLEEAGKLEEGECILSVPSDCLFSSDLPFLNTVAIGQDRAKKGEIVVFGVVPTRPETGYGYLCLGPSYREGFTVRQFVEKPSKIVAEQLVASKDVLWSIGHLLFSVDTFWQEMKIHCLEIASFQHSSFQECLEKIKEVPSISIDYALLEKSQRLVAFQVFSSWLDVGSWDSVYESLEKDESGNVKRGPVFEEESKNCLFLSEKRPFLAIGLEDLLVVDTSEGLLLVKRGYSQKVKQPPLIDNAPSKVQRKTVFLGDRVSFEGRLVVLKGKAKVFLEKEEVLFLEENDTVLEEGFVENGGEELLEILEIKINKEPALC